jgi:GNAT superfamily N-acetyltransferase
MVRRIRADELSDLVRLYNFFRPEAPAMNAGADHIRAIWGDILKNPALRYYGVEMEGRIVSTCTLTLIPNLNHNGKPYGLMENVVTDPDFRQRGLATAVLRHALAEAWAEGCYKVMLLTGSKSEATLRFYEQAGFRRGIKTGFIAYPDADVTP